MLILIKLPIELSMNSPFGNFQVFLVKKISRLLKLNKYFESKSLKCQDF